MSQYNLYYTLNLNLRKKDLTKTEKSFLLDAISKFSKDEREAFFMLIHEHHVVNKGEERTIPYNGTQTDEGIEYNLTKFPLPLRHILFKFSNMIGKRKKSFDTELDLGYRN